MNTEKRERTVLVSGVAQGLGSKIASRLLTDGYRVIGFDLNDTPEAAELREAGLWFFEADVTDRPTIQSMIGKVHDSWGPIDSVIANHARMCMAEFPESDMTDWWSQLDVNLNATFSLIRSLLPGMRERGFGRIVIVASETGVIGMPNATAYSASKAGLIALTKSLARELANERIVTNAIAPAYMDTPQLQVDAADAGVSLDSIRERYASLTPVGRVIDPAEIAAVAAYLLETEAESCVGQVLQPNGGTTRARP